MVPFYLFFLWGCLLKVLQAGLIGSNKGFELHSFTGHAEYETLLAEGKWLIMFHSPECRHCREIKPTYEEFASTVLPKAAPGKLNAIRLGQVDCKALPAICIKEDIHAVPSFKLFKDADLIDTLPTDSYSKAGLLSFVARVLELPASVEGAASGIPPETPGGPHPYLAALLAQASPVNTTGEVVILTNANYDERTREGPWFIEYFAPWCPYCRHLAPIWNETASALKNLAYVGSVDCTVEQNVCGRNGIRGYPTIRFKSGPEANTTDYWGERSVAAFTQFALKNTPPSTVISAAQLDELLTNPPAELKGQGLNANSPRAGLFLYFYMPDVASDSYDRTFITAMSTLKSTPAAFFLISDKDLIPRYSPHQVPSLFYFDLNNGGSAPMQIPSASLGSAPATLSWALDQLYPGIMAIDASTAPLILASHGSDEGESYYVYLAIVNADDPTFGTTLLPDLDKLALSVRASRSNVRFAYMNGPSFGEYINKVYGASQAPLPRYLIVDPGTETFFELASTTALQAETLLFTLDKIAEGELQGRNVRGIVARMRRSLGETVSGTVEMANSYPWLVFVGLGILMIGIVIAIRLFPRTNKRRKE